MGGVAESGLRTQPKARAPIFELSSCSGFRPRFFPSPSTPSTPRVLSQRQFHLHSSSLPTSDTRHHVRTYEHHAHGRPRCPEPERVNCRYVFSVNQQQQIHPLSNDIHPLELAFIINISYRAVEPSLTCHCAQLLASRSQRTPS